MSDRRRDGCRGQVANTSQDLHGRKNDIAAEATEQPRSKRAPGCGVQMKTILSIRGFPSKTNARFTSESGGNSASSRAESSLKIPCQTASPVVCTCILPTRRRQGCSSPSPCSWSLGRSRRLCGGPRAGATLTKRRDSCGHGRRMRQKRYLLPGIDSPPSEIYEAIG